MRSNRWEVQAKQKPKSLFGIGLSFHPYKKAISDGCNVHDAFSEWDWISPVWCEISLAPYTGVRYVPIIRTWHHNFITEWEQLISRSAKLLGLKAPLTTCQVSAFSKIEVLVICVCSTFCCMISDKLTHLLNAQCLMLIICFCCIFCCLISDTQYSLT